MYGLYIIYIYYIPYNILYIHHLCEKIKNIFWRLRIRRPFLETSTCTLVLYLFIGALVGDQEGRGLPWAAQRAHGEQLLFQPDKRLIGIWSLTLNCLPYDISSSLVHGNPLAYHTRCQIIIGLKWYEIIRHGI